MTSLSTKSLSQKRKLYGRSATAYSYRPSPNRSLSVEDAEDLAQSLIDKPIVFDEELAVKQQSPLTATKFSELKTTTDYQLQTEQLKSEHRTRTSSGGTHQLATNFNNRKARYHQPFGRQLSTGGLLTTGYSSFKQRISPTSSNQFINTSFQSRTIHSEQSSSPKKSFLSESAIDTNRLVDAENLIINDLIQQQQKIDSLSDINRLANIGKKSDLRSGQTADSSEPASQARLLGLKQKSCTDELTQDSFELRNMNAIKSSKLITTSSLGSGNADAGFESRNSAAGSSSPITTPINRTSRPTTFTLNMPQTSLPGSPKESTNLMRQFSDRDEISLYGTPKEEMPHSGFHGDSRTANFMRNQIEALFQPSDNKLAMKLFGSKKALMKERERQKESGLWIIHPCSNFRFYWGKF